MNALRWLGAVYAAISIAACAAGAKPVDDSPTSNILAGAGGGGGAGGGSGGAGGMVASSAMASSSSGPPGSCVKQADCAALVDACNVGSCVNGMCEKVPASDGSSCDDGLYCTDNDACQSGTCVGGTQKFCPSPDSCHVGACDEATKACGQAPGNDGASCDDGDPCTYSGTCSNGVCSKGQQVDCSAFNGVCADGVCDPVLGCIAKPKNDGAACDDGLYCTVQDKCSAGACSGVPNTCAAPGDVCMVGSCNEAQKSCVAVPGNDGNPCDDGNPCTVSEMCGAGKCKGGVPGNNGMACDDGDGCTAGTTCNAGSCGNAQSQIVQCIAGDSCCPAGCDKNTDSDCKPLGCSGPLAVDSSFTLDASWSSNSHSNFHPQGMTYDEFAGNFVIALQGARTLHLVSLAGNPVGTVDLSSPDEVFNYMTAIAADANYYYISDYACNNNCPDLWRVPKGSNGAARVQVSADQAAFGGYPVALSGTTLYRGNFSNDYDWSQENQVRVADLASPDNVVNTFSVPIARGIGDMTSDGTTLWMLGLSYDGSPNRQVDLYRIDPSNGLVIESYLNVYDPGGSFSPAGLAYTNGALYVLNYSTAAGVGSTMTKIACK
jgi:hypothetical protein